MLLELALQVLSGVSGATIAAGSHLVLVEVDVHLWMSLHKVGAMADGNVAMDKRNWLFLDEFNGCKGLGLHGEVFTDKSRVCLHKLVSVSLGHRPCGCSIRRLFVRRGWNDVQGVLRNDGRTSLSSCS